MPLSLSKASRINVALLIMLAVSLLAALVMKYASPPDHHLTSIWTARNVLSFRFFGDSWDPINRAFEHWRQGAPNVYAETFFKGTKFQYPPSAVFLAFLPKAFNLAAYNLPYHVVSLFFFLVTLLCAERLIAAAPGARLSTVARLSLVAALGLLFHPLTIALQIGQVQMWLGGLFALALLGWVSGRRVLPGVLIGLICLVKPQLSLFLLWGLLRREWRFAAALALTGGVGLAASVLTFGLDDHLEYLRVLSLIADRGESYYPNQSINGLLNRLMSLKDPVGYYNLDFVTGRFPPHNALVKFGTMATSAVILLLALAPRKRPGDPGKVLDFCIMALSCTMASPVAWEHHYGLTFPIFAVLLVRVWGRARWMMLLAVSYFLVSQFMNFTAVWAATPFNFVQSYVLFGGLLLLALLHLAPAAAAPAALRATRPAQAAAAA